MLDSGANKIFFPSYHSNHMSDYIPNKSHDSVTVANGQKLHISGSALLGSFPILIVPGLLKPLISESFLTTHFDILIVRYQESTWLIDAQKAKDTNINPTDYIIAKADLEDDGLYYISNILDFANATPKPIRHVTFQANQTSTTKQNLLSTHTRGRYQGRFKHLLPLKVLKVRLGFPSLNTIKKMVRDQSLDGLGVTYNEIKHLSVNKSLAEYKGKMTAFPIYPSLFNKPTHQLFVWTMFLYLSKA
jgi:hypothetical protein